jgi:hypothetical protein
MKYAADNKVDIICIQEPYIYQGRAAGLDSKYRTYTAGEAQSRTAITIRNKEVDAMLISQLSDEDNITLEITRGDTTLILASMYWDRQKPIEQDLTKFDKILKHGIREGVIIAMDSNARSTTWHDTTTNNRGKQLEEYIMSKQLHIMNEPSTKTTFENRIGKSNIDLTLATSNVLRRITDWSISDEKSNSDHSIISYDIKTSNNHKNNTNTKERKFGVHSVNTEKYKENIHRTVESIIWERSKENGEDDLDTRLYERILKDNQTEKQMEDFSEAMRIACEQSFKTKKARKTP